MTSPTIAIGKFIEDKTMSEANVAPPPTPATPSDEIVTIATSERIHPRKARPAPAGSAVSGREPLPQGRGLDHGLRRRGGCVRQRQGMARDGGIRRQRQDHAAAELRSGGSRGRDHHAADAGPAGRYQPQTGGGVRRDRPQPRKALL